MGGPASPTIRAAAGLRSAMRRTAIGFTSQGLKLEGVLSVPEDLSARAPGAPGVSETSGNLPAILMCHPHPKLGGDMESPVVLAVCGAAAREGIASMRFNFRGVGDSEGAFSDGEGEQKDMEAALSVLRRWPGIDGKRLAVAGYSFGAAVILDGLKLCKPAQSFALIAPPVSSVRRSRIGRDRRPRLFVVGSRDGISSSVDLQRALDDTVPDARSVEIPGADHGLGSHEETVAEHVAAFVKEATS